MRRFLLALALLLVPPTMAAAQQSDGRNTTRVTLEARLTDGGTTVASAVAWRVFGTAIGDDGKLPLLAEASGGVQAFDMSPGEYYVHAAYGFAGALRRIAVGGEDSVETFTLNAGGMQLNGVTTGGGRVPANLLRFDIYADAADERGERQLIARNVRPNEVVPFTAGTYHVVSQYGSLNAEIRADLRVEPGKVTQATIEHRAARMSFRLVQTDGGDALADTNWSIITESGDVIIEVASAFPSAVLSEGNYTAIAKNNDKIYSRDFEVLSGIDQEIELLAE
jgi:hypothetical protein